MLSHPVAFTSGSDSSGVGSDSPPRAAQSPITMNDVSQILADLRQIDPSLGAEVVLWALRRRRLDHDDDTMGSTDGKRRLSRHEYSEENPDEVREAAAIREGLRAMRAVLEAAEAAGVRFRLSVEY